MRVCASHAVGHMIRYAGDGDMGMGDEDWDFDAEEGDARGDSAARMEDALRRRGKVSRAPCAAGMRALLS